MRRLHVGDTGQPVLILDDVTGDVAAAVDTAAALAPFPPSDSYYPGLRRMIGPRDAAGAAYVRRLLGAIAPDIVDAFGAEGFDLVEASFSLVTAAPGSLGPAQRIPHFDSVDPDLVAVLHYLGGAGGSGTAFYRQRDTGIELVSEANRADFIEAARPASEALTGYTGDTNAYFERIGHVDAVPDRVVAYRGALLHSGIIPREMTFDSDPRRGRLTANLFVRLH